MKYLFSYLRVLLLKILVKTYIQIVSYDDQHKPDALHEVKYSIIENRIIFFDFLSNF